MPNFISPDTVLLHYTKEFLAKSSFSQATFLHDKLLPALAEAGIEQPEEHTVADEYETWRANRVRYMNSILNGRHAVPARWIWVWLNVLPAPYGIDARAELLALGNVLEISGQFPTDNNNRADLAGIMREMADVMEAGAAVAADGIYDNQDDKTKLQKLADELTDVITCCASEIAAIGKVVPLDGRRSSPIAQMCKPTK